MSGYEQVRTSISYITGEVRLEFEPPHGFVMEPRVEVDGVPAQIAPLGFGTAKQVFEHPTNELTERYVTGRFG